MVKFSYNELVYANEDIEQSIERVSQFGYDGIELSGEEPKDVNTSDVNTYLDSYGIEVSSICGIYTDERDLSSSDEEVRANAIQYVKDSIDLAVAVDADIVGVAPSPVNKIYPETDEDQEWRWAVNSIQEAAAYSADQNIELAIEPWNRYETYFINTATEAIDLAADVNHDSVGVRLDTFHMNIEENSLIDGLNLASDYLIHVHGAGSTRGAPGRGHLNWDEIVSTLKEIGYDQYITFELLPAAADPFMVLEHGKRDATEFYDQYTRESINHLKNAWDSN